MKYSLSKENLSSLKVVIFTEFENARFKNCQVLKLSTQTCVIDLGVAQKAIY